MLYTRSVRERPFSEGISAAEHTVSQFMRDEPLLLKEFNRRR
jgi:hypothetical protein